MQNEKKTVCQIPLDQLFLDPKNPRLPESVQGKNEGELLKALYRGFSLDELADSIRHNGYFAEEPLVAIVDPDEGDTTEKCADLKKRGCKFFVVEGNRRLATVKLLSDDTSRGHLGRAPSFDMVDAEMAANLRELPVIVYHKREEVQRYLGVRHIIGVQKWDAYAKARYIAGMVKEGTSLADLQNEIGDRKRSAKVTYACYNLLEQLEDYDNSVELGKAKNRFSFVQLAVGHKAVKDFLGMPARWADVDEDEPVPPTSLGKLKDLFSWLFGVDGKTEVIQESRDITNKLCHVLASEEATEELRKHRNLDEAFEQSDGKDEWVRNSLSSSSRKLKKVAGELISRSDLGELGLQCREDVEQLVNLVESIRQSLGLGGEND